MIFWLDAQLPPALARFLAGTFGVEAITVSDLGLRDATDRSIFDKARALNAAVITKDSDFVELVERFGSPPQIVWVTCGNSSNEHVQSLFAATFADALNLIAAGAALVEIADAKRAS